jgi:putative transposase
LKEDRTTESENARLKKLSGDAILDHSMLKDLLVTRAAKREAVAHLHSAFDTSERRACRTIGCVQMTSRYRLRRRWI